VLWPIMPSSAVGEGVKRWSRSPMRATRSHNARTEMTYLNGSDKFSETVRL
jgi:hypothetical protein